MTKKQITKKVVKGVAFTPRSLKTAAAPTGRSRQGFGSLSPKRRKAIASLGGQAVSKLPGHMSRIGKIGGSR